MRQAISKLHGNVSADQIIVGTGSKELIFLVMNIFHGDIILVSPGWTTYAPQVRLAKQKCFVVNTEMNEEWKVTPKSLMELLEQNPDISTNKLLILNNPGNPCKSFLRSNPRFISFSIIAGTVYSAEELQKLR